MKVEANCSFPNLVEAIRTFLKLVEDLLSFPNLVETISSFLKLVESFR